VNQSKDLRILHDDLAQVIGLLNPLSPELLINLPVFLGNQSQRDQRFGAIERSTIDSTFPVLDDDNATRI
jgi:hypothetical protein